MATTQFDLGKRLPIAGQDKDFAMAESGNSRLLGMIGEAVAERFLIDSGLVLIERNWRCDQGEIDLIFKDPSSENPGEIVFVEVKTRSSSRFGIGSEAITAEKNRRLHRLAIQWSRSRGVAAKYRIDVISIDSLALPRVTHLKRVIL